MACQTSLTALVWWWCVCSPPSWEKECGDMKRHNYSLLQVELCWETQSLLQRRSSNVAQWDSQRSGNLRNHPLLKAKISVFFTFLCAGPILWMMVRGRKEGLIGLFSLRKYLDSLLHSTNTIILTMWQRRCIEPRARHKYVMHYENDKYFRGGQNIHKVLIMATLVLNTLNSLMLYFTLHLQFAFPCSLSPDQLDHMDKVEKFLTRKFGKEEEEMLTGRMSSNPLYAQYCLCQDVLRPSGFCADVLGTYYQQNMSRKQRRSSDNLRGKSRYLE